MQSIAVLHRGWGSRWAAALCLVLHAACAGAIVVNDSAELNAALDDGETDITLGTPGTYTVTAPRTIMSETFSIDSAENPANTAEYILTSGGTGPLFDINPGGAESVNASFQGVVFAGGTAVMADGDTGLTFTRCLFDGGAQAVVLNNPTKQTWFAQCVFNNTAPGVAINGTNTWSLTFYQCTILGGALLEGTGDGTVDVAFCLFDGTGSVATVDPNVAFNWLYSLNGASAASPFTPDANDTTEIRTDGDLSVAPAFNTGSWPGKLAGTTEIKSGIPSGDATIADVIDTVDAAGLLDFEKQRRDYGDIQIGADEGGAGGPYRGVQTVEISGGNRNADGAIVVGPDTPLAVTIEITTIDLDLTDAIVWIQPQTALTGDLDQYVQAPISSIVNQNTGTIVATFRPAATCVNGILQDGLASVFLSADGDFWLDSTFPPLDNNADLNFIVDTVAPVLYGGIASNRAPFLVKNTSDSIPVNGAFTPYPDQWSPASGPWGWSDGSLAGNRNAQAFLNAGGPLSFDFEIEFQDLPPNPCLDGGLTTLNIAGFADEGLPVIPDALLGIEDLIGIPRVQPASLPAILDSGLNPGVTVSGAFVNDRVLDIATLSLQFAGVTTGNSVGIPLLFEASDAAGNKVTVDNELIVWWLLRNEHLASLSGGTVDPDDLRIPWDVVRSVSPEDTFPAYLIARYRLFRPVPADLASNSNNPRWVSDTPWSAWTSSRVLNAETPFSGNLRLGDLLSSAAYAGGPVLLALQTADEAGNVSPFDANGVDLTTNAVTVSSKDAFGDVPVVTWLNEATGAGLETSVEGRIWYNRVDDGDLRKLEPTLGEVTFGGANRVPIVPEDDCLFRIEAQFNLIPSFPVPTALPDTARIDWQFYEDSRLVCSGFITIDNTNYIDGALLTFPEDLFSQGSNVNVFNSVFVGSPISKTAFLNTAPADCNPQRSERLGDDGDTPQFRRREVNYSLVARTYAADASGNEQVDTTPATYQFSVYVPDEAPTGNPPVKIRTTQ